MDNWPRIPGAPSSSSPSRGGSNLPPPGTVVMASVEEDLGDGMYALRWAGNRIAVSSRVSLSTGQSLILKSEISAEGKPTLVVQGPALPEPGMIAGPVIYRPGKRQVDDRQSQSQPQPEATNRGSGTTPQSAGQAGGDMAAGVARVQPFAGGGGSGQSSLLGLVLEPLPEFAASAEQLLTEAEEEIRIWKQYAGQSSKTKDAHKEQRPDAGQSREQPAVTEKSEPDRSVLSRPSLSEAVRPPQSGVDGVGTRPETGFAPSRPDQPVSGLENGRQQDSVQVDAPEQRPRPLPGDAKLPEAPVEQGRERPAPLPLRPDSASAQPVADPLPKNEATPIPGTLESVFDETGRAPSGTLPTYPDPRPTPGIVPTPHLPPANAGPVVPEVVTPETGKPSADSPPVPYPESRPAPTPVETAPSQQQQSQPSQSGQAVPEAATPETGKPSQELPSVELPGSRPSDNAQEQSIIRESQSGGETVPLPGISSDVSSRPALPHGQQDGKPPAPFPPPEGTARPGPAEPDLPTNGGEAGRIPPGESAGTVVREPPQNSSPPDNFRPAPPPIPDSAKYETQTPGADARPTPVVSEHASRESSLPPENIRPEVFLKEALTQVVKAAELPLASPGADNQSLGVGGRMPDAVADKAAGILLRAAGLTPDPETLEVAKALIDNNVPVDRQTVQAVLALAAGAEETEREAVIRAAARLTAKDIPLAAPLASGLADVIERKAGVHELALKAVDALAVDPDFSPLPSARPLMESAKELLDMLHVDLGSVDAASALERYVSTFGREALGKALALVEKATQTTLENHPLLPQIDRAMTMLLTLLERDIVEADEKAPATAESLPVAKEAKPAAPAAVEGEPHPAPDSPVREGIAQAKPAPGINSSPNDETMSKTETPTAPAPPRPPTRSFSPINAYLNAPKAFPGLESLDLPPMPKVAKLPPSLQPSSPVVALPSVPVVVPEQPLRNGQEVESPVSPRPVFVPPENGQNSDRVFLPETQTPSPEQPARSREAPIPQQGEHVAEPPFLKEAAGSKGPVLAEENGAEQKRPLDNQIATERMVDNENAARSSVLRRLDSIFQIPGLNRPEVELLRPSGLLERFLNALSDSPENAERVRREAAAVVRDLVSKEPEKVEAAIKELPKKEPAVLREVAARLSRAEAELMKSEPVLNRLADAASSLRELGRQLLAVKAENLAGQNREPGVMLAEVPFKLADDAGDGRMQMFYRRSNRKGDGWSSRVILDLNTTGMGPVLGDMRFFGQDMVLNMFVEKPETADFLGKSAAELGDALKEKGFRLKSRFMVLPPPPSAPEIRAERPEIAGEDSTAKDDSVPGGVALKKNGRLDVKG